MTPRIILALCFLLILLPFPAHAEDAPAPASSSDSSSKKHKHHDGKSRRHHSAPVIIITPNIPQPVCIENSVVICNKFVPVSAGYLGDTKTLKVPAPYKHQSFTVQCMNDGGLIQYRIIDQSAVTCEAQICPPSNVSLCGRDIALNGGTPVGNTISTPVPSSLLSNPAAGVPYIKAQCVDSGDVEPVYQITNASYISCTQFPCPDATVRLCNTQIPIPGGTPLGGVMQVYMPKPFVNDPFTVQCIGSNAQPPFYQITDHSLVSCTLDSD